MRKRFEDMGGVVIIGIVLMLAVYFWKKGIDSRAATRSVQLSQRDKDAIIDMAERIGEVINESQKIASESSNPETVISRLKVTKDKVAQLEAMVEEYPFIDLLNLDEVKKGIAEFEDTVRPMTSTYPTDAVSQVKRLKKEGKNVEAINVLIQCIESMESNADQLGGVAPWYYEQLAILYRKEKRLEDELNILERYSRQTKAPGAGPEKLKERLEKIRAKISKS